MFRSGRRPTEELPRRLKPSTQTAVPESQYEGERTRWEGLFSGPQGPVPELDKWLGTALIWILGGVLTFLVIGPRFAMLDHGLWHDEVTTSELFVREGPQEIIFGNFRLNNHVLYSLIAWSATQVFGHTDFILRVPSLLPGVFGALVLGLWLGRRYHPLAGIVGVLFIAASPFHLALVPQARGYGLAYLYIPLMIVLGDSLTREVTRWRLVAFALSGFLAASTLIVLAVPFAAITIGLLVWWRREVANVVRLGLAAMVAGTATAILMAPALLSSARSFVGGVSGGAPLRWHAAVTLWFQEDWVPIVETLALGWRGGYDPRDLGLGSLSVIIVAVITVGLTSAAAVAWKRQIIGGTSLVLVSVVPLVATYLAVRITQGADGNVPYRYLSSLFVFVIPILAVGIVATSSWLISILGRNIKPLGEHPVLALAVLGAMLVLVGSIGVGRLGKYYAEVPLEANKEIAHVVNQIDETIPVVTNSVRTGVLRYYIDRELIVRDADEIDQFVCSSSGPLVIINHPYRTSVPKGPCLEERRFSTVRYVQRGRGFRMELFFLAGMTESAIVRQATDVMSP